MTTPQVLPPSGEKYALLIAVENYQDASIIPVKYAENDATALASALKGVGFPDANIELLLSSSATKTRIESAIRSLCRRLRKNDEFYFFYAGHGFAENNHNFITCNDTLRRDMCPTSIRLQDILVQIRSVGIQKTVLMLDCCQSGVDIDEDMRGLLTDMMQDEEFVSFCAESECHMAFAACRADESSYISNQLNHGIWSYHVIEAFKGNAPLALARGRFLTASSLLDYLSIEVPKTIRRNYNDGRTQTPKLWGDMSREFILADLEAILARKSAQSMQAVGHLERASLWGFVCGSIKSLSGFNKRFHRVPDNVSDATRSFVHKVGSEELEDAKEDLFADLTEQFGYLLDDIELSSDAGDVTIQTPQFKVNITLDINEDDPGKYEISTELTDITDLTVLDTDAFATVFDDKFDRIIFNVSGEIPVAKVIGAIQALKDPSRISVDYPSSAASCTVHGRGLTGDILFSKRSITIKLPRKASTTELLKSSRAALDLLQQRGISGLLPSPKGK